MIVKDEVIQYENSLNENQLALFKKLCNIISKVNDEVVAIIFVKQPYFYLLENERIKPHYRPSIMLSFFNDHVNIFSPKCELFEERLSQYQFTKNKNLQIKLDQKLDEVVLLELFIESLKSI